MSVVGETLLSCALTEIFTKINSVVIEGISGAWKLEADLEKLRELIWRIQEAQVTADDENFWKLQEVIYCAENVMDEFHYKILRREVENQLKHKLRDFVSLNNPLLFRIGMATRVEKLNKKVPLLENRGTPAPPPAAATTGVDLPSLKERVTHSYLENTPFGRTREVKAIIEMLQATSSRRPPFTVVSIVGFGGLGKTFLAKLVKKEAQEKKLFDEFMWVCVSESFDCGKILREMLQKLDQNGGMQSSIDATIHHLQQKLKDKSSFLVLDDVWNEEYEKWDNLKECLKNICGESGNFVIVVTTRSKVVDGLMDSIHMVELKQLSDVECWSIIKERVVGNEGESIISHDMEIIGMEIAKKCGGVPLAAKVLGGVLRSPKNEDDWLSIQLSNVWNEVDKDKRTSGVLKLSFDRLPPPQKLCFAYCSLFPKDFVFEKTQLIQLWMAEDFLKTTLTNGGRRVRLMEDVGEEYFHSLLVNSLFQDAQVDDCGNIVRCKMHDLLHDLALSISKSQRLQCGSDCIQTSEGRRFNCSCDQGSKIQENLESSEDKTRNSRSLFCRVDVSPMLSNFRRLRSLDMSDAKLENLPAAIRKLKHLRYLDISKNEAIQVLPESVTKLYNLQTLRVFGCKSLKELPSEIRNLVSLRHIGFDDKRLMPFKVGGLTDLQTLPFFVVGLQEGQTINELEELKELRGELVVCGLENVRDKGEAERAKMKEKKLSELALQWMEVEENEVENFCSSREGKHEEVMEGIGAPTNTQSLTTEWYMGKQFPEWMSELRELVKLTLKNCRRCVAMPSLGHLRNLKILRVERMDSMKAIGGEFYGESNMVETLFPLLEEFSIREMKSLVEWVAPKGTEIFPKLRDLWIEDCPNLTSIPLSQSTSSAISIRLWSHFKNVHSVDILCFTDFKSLEDIWIQGCPKLTFLRIGLTSLEDFRFLPKYYISRQQMGWVENLSVCSNELGESWKMMRINGVIELISEFSKSLEALKIEDFSKLSVEAFHGLSCLKHLVISHCDRLESIPSLSFLTSLEHLEINSCLSLQSIPSLSSLKPLKHLKIAHCCSLESIPSLSSFTSLEHLEINGSPRLQSIPSLSSLNSLKYLKIIQISRNCDRPESIPITCLEELHLRGCHNWSVPGEIKLCTSLKALTFSHCGKIVSIDDDIIGSLTQLKELEWGPFSKELDQLPGLNLISLLTSLQKLKIIGWEKLTSLPHQLQHLTSITHLIIQFFDGVESLPDWFCNFSSLQSLTIFYCENLKNLTTGMQRLSKLTSLDIYGCRLLAERCAEDIGPEWSNISHIPHIRIDLKVIKDVSRGRNAEISI